MILKDIPGFEDRYAISDDGRVFNKKRNKFLKPTSKKGWYVQVTFIKDGKRIPFRLHVLVGNAFLEPQDGRNEFNHRNGIKTDNRVVNLERCNRSENIRHALTILKAKRVTGSNHPKHRLILDFQTGIYYDSTREAAEAKCISRCKLKNNIRTKRQYQPREPMKFGLAYV